MNKKIPPPDTESYKAALKLTQLHHASQTKTFSGQFTWKNRKHIKEVIDQYDIKTILDYGSGRGKQYNRELNLDEDGKSLEEYWGISPTKYDPGIPEISAEPSGVFDLVLCVQVLGSIPLQDLPQVIDRLYGFAGKVLFVVERIGNPRKRIYNEIQHLMPRGLKIDDWEKLLYRPETEVELITHFKEKRKE